MGFQAQHIDLCFTCIYSSSVFLVSFSYFQVSRLEARIKASGERLLSVQSDSCIDYDESVRNASKKRRRRKKKNTCDSLVV